ncbi:PIG-P [Lentinula edodes]|nr:PIG-P [Lentinula edodes]
MTILTEPISHPPNEYRSRAPEFYGFVAWTSTSFLFVVYVLWALLPDEYIVRAGVEWYPNREWALLLPAWSMVVVLLTYFTYMALTIYGTPAFDEPSAVTGEHFTLDECAYIAYLLSSKIPEPSFLSNLELYDIPIELVNRVLYTEDRRSEQE